jgi:4-azaleucine resistance transporter AzlC
LSDDVVPTGPAEGTDDASPVSFTARGFFRGARRALALAPGDFAVGLLFGVLSKQAGLSLTEAVVMSALVNAGASQFVAIGMWASPIPALAIVATTLLVNIRHVLMGLTVRPWLSRLPPSRKYPAAFFLTDESWAMSTVEFQNRPPDGAFLVGVGATLYTSWMVWTVIGSVTGAAIHDPGRWGLDFAFVAVFLALLTSLARGWRDVPSWALAAAAAVAASRLLPGNWYVLIGAGAGCLPAVLRRPR